MMDRIGIEVFGIFPIFFFRKSIFSSNSGFSGMKIKNFGICKYICGNLWDFSYFLIQNIINSNYFTKLTKMKRLNQTLIV